MKSLRVRLQTTTPILGGAPEPRQVDAVDVIRVPSVRGHLRFWWRALHGHTCATSEQLARRERALWGGVGGDAGTRSQVELWVEVEQDSRPLDEFDVRQGDPGAYALWTARRTGSQAPAPRRKPGLRFQLHLRVPLAHVSEVEDSLRAWILWGGYGGRTRRGLGGLTVVEEAQRWLPTTPSQESLRTLFHALPGLGATFAREPRQVPSLQGARLVHGQPDSSAERAWLTALKWLSDFRQGQPSGGGRRTEGPSRFAREWGDSKRPGRSNWPEADKIRALVPTRDGSSWAHAPRAAYSRSKAAAWPRAGFGLPLATRFQLNARPGPGAKQGPAYAAGEPEEVELRWYDGTKVRERLASPVIVKAMPLADGRFVPIALWLCRAWPERGQVVLLRKARRERVAGSEAPFDRLLAPGDTALFEPLQSTGLAEAFFTWVKSLSQGPKES